MLLRKDRLFVIVLCCGIGRCQAIAQRSVTRINWHERYPAQMAPLDSMTFLPLATWRFHPADMPTVKILP